MYSSINLKIAGVPCPGPAHEYLHFNAKSAIQ